MENILRPGRYINSEWNAVHKEWDSAVLKIALLFPDIYEIGMSHLGMKILYGLLNREEGVICERAFTPFPPPSPASPLCMNLRSGWRWFIRRRSAIGRRCTITA